ncbi:MAG: amidohydrolase family protein [Cellulomonadaceae bacterium]
MSTTVIHNALLLDVEDASLTDRGWLVAADGMIADRGSGTPPTAVPDDARWIDAGGATVLPGLIDAHVHVAVTTVNVTEHASWTAGYAAVRTLEQAHRMLRRGFTTVRDVGGADHGIARILDEGRARGPRLVHGGHMISQTGGHGDQRARTEGDCRCSVVTGIAAIADGPDEMRRTVREQLRQGASHIKLAVSGGVASPHDEVAAVQFTEEEIRVAVVEAENANSYVTVHAYHPRAIRQALRAGVHCVEHGNLLDDETIAAMVERGVHLVPTLITYELLAAHSATVGLPPESIAKVAEVRDRGLSAYERAVRAGVQVAYGSDLLGPMEHAQLGELALRAQVSSPSQVIREATVNGARLLRREGQLGTLRPGAVADLIVVDGNPIDNLAVLARPEQHLRYVLQGGVVTAEPSQGAGGLFA